MLDFGTHQFDSVYMNDFIFWGRGESLPNLSVSIHNRYVPPPKKKIKSFM